MRLLHRLYYEVKPLIPRRIRFALRRRAARRARATSLGLWPINKACAIRPPDWRGWPGGKQFAVVLTHDVEGQVGYERIPELLKLERELGFKSSFNLIPEGEYKVEGQMLSFIRGEGFEVGVHDLKHDGKLYRSKPEFNRAAVRINEYLRDWQAVGFRSAFMHHNLEWLHGLNVQYDLSTFDFDPFEPQPDGVSTIFPFFVQSADRRHAYLEMPYTLVQDSTLFLFLQEQSPDVWKQKIDWLAEHGGMVLINVHPDYTCYNGTPSYREFPACYYSETLYYIRSRYAGGYWHGLPMELSNEFWKANAGRDAVPNAAHLVA